jgi:molybdopterin synthase sulfur carrier subunit
MAVKVRIPTPLRSYTAQAHAVEASGSTVDELLDDLDRQFPGIRFRMVDEQGRLREHMKVFVGNDMTRDLSTSLAGVLEVTLMQALSGG